MNITSRYGPFGTWPMICLTLAAILCGSIELRAQRFQAFYDVGNVGVGRHGVQPSINGGYVAVGQALNNIYVVRINFNGTVAWSREYDIDNGSEVANGLTECANGDLVVVGRWHVEPTAGYGDIFMMRLTPAGNVICANTYSNPDVYDEAWRVIETRFGNFGTTNPGDLVICGVTGIGIGSDAYLLRVDTCGNIVWDRAYDKHSTDELFDVVESTVPGPNQGDIIAAGYSGMPGNWGGMILRVSGNTGLMTTALHGAVVTLSPEESEFHTVKELQEGTNAGQIVAAGYMDVAPVGRAIYLRKTNPFPCAVIADVLHGDFAGAENYAMDMQEIRLTPGSMLTAGNLALTGYSSVRSQLGPGAFDVFLLELEPNGLSLAGAGFTLYGQDGQNWGRSIHPVYGGGLLPTDGFIICGGMWQSSLLPLGVSGAMYVIKTDAFGSSGCYEYPWPIYQFDRQFGPLCVHYQTRSIALRRPRLATWTIRDSVTMLCYAFPKEVTPGAAIAEESSIRAFPNPIAKGSALDLRITLAEASTSTVTVTDMAGNQVSEQTEELAAGENLVTVSAGKWAAGTYLVTVSVGGRTQTQRVVVMER